MSITTPDFFRSTKASPHLGEIDEAELYRLSLLTASQAAREMNRGRMTAEYYVRACLEIIAARNGTIEAFAHLDAEIALSQAKALDRHRLLGRKLGPLHGVPVAIKDIVDTSDYPTEYGSAAFVGRRPLSDATIVSKLRENGAIIIGKTVTTELGLFQPGKTRNPLDPTRTPGGSSSGSAAAVAAGMVPLSIGAQTSGSIIRPASYCGVFGIKPSYGSVANKGVLPAAPSLDHIGGFARSIEDLALLLDVIVDKDFLNQAASSTRVKNVRQALRIPPSAPPRCAFVRTPMWDAAQADARLAIENFAIKVGAFSVDLEPDFKLAWRAMRTIFTSELSSTLGPIVTGCAISPALRGFLSEGSLVTSSELESAMRDARSYALRLSEIFESADAIITLPATSVAPKGLADTGDPIFCALWTMAGLPSLNLPLLSGSFGLPIGVQLVGAPHRDAELLQTALALIEMVRPGRPDYAELSSDEI